MAPFHCLTFLTDYGLEDAFVAACHGVVLQIAPKTRIIDITHLVPPGDIRRGAAVLAQTVGYLPPAVHVAVVDPGVGTARRGVAIAAGDSVFVGPDNGLLSWAVAEAGGATEAVSLTNRALWLDTATATFHGRDIFMPVAAHLAAGVPLAEAGEPARRGQPRHAAQASKPDHRAAASTRRCSPSTGSATRSCPSPDLTRRGPGSPLARRPRWRGTPAS